MTLKPDDIAIPRSGIFVATLGSAEKEAVAVCLVRMHHKMEWNDWTPVTLDDFAAFADSRREDADPVVARWFENPIWAMCFFHGFHPITSEGYVEGWVNGKPESTGVVTPKFLAAIEGGHWDKRARGANAAD